MDTTKLLIALALAAIAVIFYFTNSSSKSSSMSIEPTSTDGVCMPTKVGKDQDGQCSQNKQALKCMLVQGCSWAPN